MKLDEGQLGLLLLGFACGAIALIVTLGRFIDHLQSDLSSLAGCSTFGLCVCLMPFASATWHLSLIVFVAGAGFGTLDVSMNTTASQLERCSKRHMMSSFHATFSVGNLLGAFMVGTVISYGGSLMLCLSVAGALVLLTGLVSRVIAIGNSYKSVPPTRIHTEAIATLRRSGQRKLVFLFGGLAFMSMLAEGGMMDWTAVFLVKNLGASESVGAYAFGIFAGAMALGRVLGDKLTQRIGHILTIRLGGAVCALSVTVMLISGSPVVALIALAVCGLGVANMIPAVFAAAGHIGSDAVGRAMSIVKTMGYLGLLIGPALLGFAAQTFGLGVSLFLVAAAFAFVAAESFYVHRRILQHDREFTRIGEPLGLHP
jgi:predicted MFS family arabinose efflux permease